MKVCGGVQDATTFHQRLCQNNLIAFYNMLTDFLNKNMQKIILYRFLKGILFCGILSMDTKMIDSTGIMESRQVHEGEKIE